MVIVILTISILLGLSMLSPCFQNRFLDDKNLYQFIKEYSHVDT